MSILIVDDDEDDCIIMQETFAEVALNHNIDYVLGAESALNYLRNAAIVPSLIVLDVNMPRMNGIELLPLIREGWNISVIFYTTTCTDDLIIRLKALGAIDCIQKGTNYSDALKFANLVSEIVTRAAQP